MLLRVRPYLRMNALPLPPSQRNPRHRKLLCLGRGGDGDGGLYEDVSPAGITDDERKRKELVDLSTAVSRTTKSHRHDFKRGNLPPGRLPSSRPSSLPRPDNRPLHSVPEKGRRLPRTASGPQTGRARTSIARPSTSPSSVSSFGGI